MSNCIHHWVLSTPTRGECPATCKKCKTNTSFATTGIPKRPRKHHVTGKIFYTADIPISGSRFADSYPMDIDTIT